MSSTSPHAPSGPGDAGRGPSLGLICVIFFLSGFPALIYQLIWQRSLYAIYGVNVESVTVIVAAFMLGLGLGSLAGGVISTRPRVSLLLVFGLLELGIAAFGLVSLQLFELVGRVTLGSGTGVTGVITFGLVVIPTLLMGATLPILVAHLVRESGNVGRSVGLLYFVNTLGSATACFFGALFLFWALGRRGSMYLAVALNTSVGLTALYFHLRGRAGARDAAGVTPAKEPGSRASTAADSAPPVPGVEAPAIRLPAAVAVSFLCGYVSLSYEILLFRVYTITSGGLAAAFAFVLGAFLAGIAIGSLVAGRYCRDGSGQDRGPLLRALATFLILANLAGFLVIPAVANAIRVVPFHATLPLVLLTAGLLGAAFPLVTHFGVRPGPRAGAEVSYLYLANIAGSVGGSLITGFVLMQHFSLGSIVRFLALVGLAMGAALLPSATRSLRGRGLGFGAVATAAVLVVATTGPLFHGVYEKLIMGRGYHSGIVFPVVLENRSGVLALSQKGVLYGNGSFDGVVSTDIIEDRNVVVRPYSISAFHPAPREVLMVGLATGSWAQVVANHPQLERLTVVEINRGYRQIVASQAPVKSLLENPKVSLEFDDGRRWLARHPDRKFDFIVMNTVNHWRSLSINLLSVEFFRGIKRHLKPGGVLMYNATECQNVMRTGATVFPYAYRYMNHMVVSDSPIVIDPERLRKILLAYRMDGEPLLDLSKPAHRQVLDHALRYLGPRPDGRYHWWSTEDRESILRRTEGRFLFTEDNMGYEWAYLKAPVY